MTVCPNRFSGTPFDIKFHSAGVVRINSVKSRMTVKKKDILIESFSTGKFKKSPKHYCLRLILVDNY
jgi:hypothetical protein